MSTFIWSDFIFTIVNWVKSGFDPTLVLTLPSSVGLTKGHDRRSQELSKNVFPMFVSHCGCFSVSL